MIKKICIIAFMAVFSLKAAGQGEYSPPSPIASSIQKSFISSIKLYEGKVDVKIPIYTVKSRSLTVNVDLNYTGSSGIKVQEVAGVAGLGWSLGVGGAITATRRSGSDQSVFYGYFAANAGARWLNSPVGSSDFFKAFNFQIGTYSNDDLLPDIFNSSIGGKIFFDRNKNPYFANNQGYKIIQNGITSPDKIWIISDPDGNKYSFGKDLNAIERSMILTVPPTFGEISTWHLSEIRSPDGDLITFEYEKSGAVNKFLYYSDTYDVSNGSTTSPPLESGENFTAHEEIHLSKIKTNDATIQFTYIDRLDFPTAKALSEISVLDQNLEQVKKYSFETGYFQGTERRLKLNAVREYSQNEDKSNIIASFVYNETINLPARNSVEFDHWGYHNDNTTGTALVSRGANKSANLEKCKANILTAIEEPTGGKTQFDYQLNSYNQNSQLYTGGGLRILKVTQVGTDGNTLATNYSYNDEADNTSGLINVPYNITSGYITLYSYYGTPFIYESTMPIQQAYDNDGISIGYSRVTVRNPNLGIEIYSFQDFNQFPDSLINLAYEHSNQSEVSNVAVWPYLPGIHKQFNYFTSNAMNRGLLKDKQIKNSNGQLLQKTNYYYNTHGGVRVPGSEILSNGSYEAFGIERDKYIASLFYEKQMTSRLIKTIVQNYDGPTQNLLVSNVTRNEYGFSSYPSLLTKQISSTSSSTDSVITEFHYPFEFPNIAAPNAATEMVANNIFEPLEVVSKISKGASILTTAAKINFYKLVGSNLIVPDKVLSLKADNPLTNYTSLSVNGTYDSRIKEDLSYDSYGSNGELQQITKPGNISTSFMWDKNSSKMIATAENSTIDKLVYDNAEAVFGTNLWTSNNGIITTTDFYSGKSCYATVNCTKQLPAGSYKTVYRFKGNPISIAGSAFMLNNTNVIGPDSRGWKTMSADFTLSAGTTITLNSSGAGQFVDDIRILPTVAKMTTSTSELLKGTTSLTDEKLHTIFYEYDGFHRLKSVKDQNGHVVKSYDYHYKTQN